LNAGAVAVLSKDNLVDVAVILGKAAAGAPSVDPAIGP